MECLGWAKSEHQSRSKAVLVDLRWLSHLSQFTTDVINCCFIVSSKQAYFYHVESTFHCREMTGARCWLTFLLGSREKFVVLYLAYFNLLMKAHSHIK